MHDARTVRAASAHRLTIALYATASFLYWIGLHLYVPTLPTHMR